jgi:hypothetical protein
VLSLRDRDSGMSLIPPRELAADGSRFEYEKEKSSFRIGSPSLSSRFFANRIADPDGAGDDDFRVKTTQPKLTAYR